LTDLPNFAAWERQTLDRFALDAYIRLQQQQEALEQLRQDLRDAMALLRKCTCASAVNDQRLAPGFVSNADMRPSVILSDDLVIG
jgi:hypothetical protein